MPRSNISTSAVNGSACGYALSFLFSSLDQGSTFTNSCFSSLPSKPTSAGTLVKDTDHNERYASPFTISLMHLRNIHADYLISSASIGSHRVEQQKTLAHERIDAFLTDTNTSYTYGYKSMTECRQRLAVKLVDFDLVLSNSHPKP